MSAIFIIFLISCISLINFFTEPSKVEAATTVINPDGTGYWEDMFDNLEGIEILDNVELNGGNVELEYNIELTDDFNGTDGFPPDTSKWDLIDDGYILEFENNQLRSEITIDTPSWNTEMVRTKRIFDYNHTINWRQKLHLTDGDGMYYHFFVLNGSSNTRIFGSNQNHANEYHPIDLINMTSKIAGLNFKGWYNFTIIFENGNIEFFINDKSEFNFNSGVKSIKYEFGTHSLAEDSLIYTDYISLSAFSRTGHLISKEISMPENKYWESLKIEKSNDTIESNIKVSILNGQTYKPIPGFENLSIQEFDISGIDPISNPTIRLQANFFGNGLLSPKLNSWRVSWQNNDIPEVSSILFSGNSVFRTRSITISAVGTDSESIQSELIPSFNYKSPYHQTWQTGYLSTPYFFYDRWCVTFTPPAVSDPGYYDIRVKFDDLVGSSGSWVYSNDSIEVLNNKPTAPEVNITPESPGTLDDLFASITVVSRDVENEPITYTFRWVLNNVLQDSLTQQFSPDLVSKVPSWETKKGDIWMCVVTPNDGIDDGASGNSTEIVIQNSPAKIMKPMKDIIMKEDISLTLENKLSEVFTDVDDDDLIFDATGQEHIDIEINQENGTVILKPHSNWYGTDTITFSASDGLSAPVFQTINVTVEPTNDLPTIVKVGGYRIITTFQKVDFMINQNEAWNITVLAEDIDGDAARGKIEFSMNVTAQNNLFLTRDAGTLYFYPSNDDVGLHFIRIFVTDNNETPVTYVYQDIKILVINQNDPPSVHIIEPLDGSEFSESDSISLICTADDIDLLIPNSTEKLSFRWFTTISVNSELGKDRELHDIKLKPGEYNITVEVKDSSNVKVYDYVHISIIRDNTGDTNIFSNVYFWIILIIVLIAIIISIFFISRRKRAGDGDDKTGQSPPPVPAAQISLPYQLQTDMSSQGPPSIPDAPLANLPHQVPVQIQPPIPPAIYLIPKPQVMVQKKMEIKEASETQPVGKTDIDAKEPDEQL